MATPQQADRFAFWVPFDIEKAGPADGSGPGFGKIRGIVSSERVDEDGEVIVQKGIDWTYFLENGKLTYGHPASVANVIGEPTGVSPTSFNGTAATMMEGRLFLADRMGKACYEKATMMEKSGARARLGLSVEGHVIERDPADPKRITKSKVITVAVDASPKNPDARLELAASLGAPVPNDITTIEPSRPAAPVRPEIYKGVSRADLLALRVLKRQPTWTYAAARAFLQSVHEATQ